MQPAAVDLATIELRLTADDREPADDDAGGFLAGLAAGWDAFTRAGTTLRAAVGAVLPFVGVLALVVAGVVAVRRRRDARRVEEAPNPG